MEFDRVSSFEQVSESHVCNSHIYKVAYVSSMSCSDGVQNSCFPLSSLIPSNTPFIL